MDAKIKYRIATLLLPLVFVLGACDSGSPAGNNANANAGNNNNNVNNNAQESCDNGVDDDGDGDIDCADGDCVADPACAGDSCDGVDCSGHGTCDDSSGAAVCVCDTGYMGAACAACDTGYQDNDNNSSCLVDCTGISCAGTCDDSSGVALCDRDGTYTGMIHVDLTDIGFVVNYDSCDAAITVVVSVVSSPQITASTTCYPQGILAGQSLDIDIEGNITTDPTVAGVVYLDWNTSFMPQDTWTGSFTGPNTIVGAFDGDEWLGSASFVWDATFSAVR